MDLYTPEHESSSWYKEYLASPEWKHIRQQKMFNSPFCECCGGAGEQVHHLIYRKNSFGNLEPNIDEDLVTLCNKCHKAYHTLDRRKKFIELNERVDKGKSRQFSTDIEDLLVYKFIDWAFRRDCAFCLGGRNYANPKHVKEDMPIFLSSVYPKSLSSALSEVSFCLKIQHYFAELHSQLIKEEKKHGATISALKRQFGQSAVNRALY